jgi:hypothetical protein
MAELRKRKIWMMVVGGLILYGSCSEMLRIIRENEPVSPLIGLPLVILSIYLIWKGNKG